jgi:hypothetical protein
MASRTWKLGDTWVKVAWEELGEETRYRDIIEANPGYNPKKEPAPGTRIEIPDPKGAGTQTADTDYYPWASKEAALERLLEYTTLAIYLREQVNGRIRN